MMYNRLYQKGGDKVAERHQVALKLSDEEHKTLKQLAEKEGMAMAGFVRYLIKELVKHGHVEIERR